MSDNDFLKRELVGAYTAEVLLNILSNQMPFCLFVQKIQWLTWRLNLLGLQWSWNMLKIGKTIHCIDLIQEGITLPYNVIEHDLSIGEIIFS